jgi:hypothetical protein
VSVLGGVRPLLSGLFGRYDSPNPSIVVTPSRSTLVEILGSGLDEGESAGFNLSVIPTPHDLSFSGAVCRCSGMSCAISTSSSAISSRTLAITPGTRTCC